MVLFVITVALAIVLGTLATRWGGEWRRIGVIAVVTGIAGWLATGACMAILAGVPAALLVVVAAALTLPVREVTLRLFDPAGSPPLHWATMASGGIAAAALEGYAGYQAVVVPHQGVDMDVIALFTTLTALTISVTGAMALALHMRSVNPEDSPDLIPAALRRITGPGSAAAVARRLGSHARDQLRVVAPWAVSNDK